MKNKNKSSHAYMYPNKEPTETFLKQGENYGTLLGKICECTEWHQDDLHMSKVKCAPQELCNYYPTVLHNISSVSLYDPSFST